MRGPWAKGLVCAFALAAITADSRGKVRDAAWNVGPKGPFGRQDIVSIPLVGSPVGPSL